MVPFLTGGEGDLLAWYRFPAFPFLAILGAWGLQMLVDKSNLFTSFLAAGLLLGGRSLLVNAFRSNMTPSGFRLVLALLLMPPIISSIFEKKWLLKLNKFLIIALISVGVYFNVIYIYNAFELECESISCSIVPSTALSTLHFPLIWRWFVLK
ncbi:MAG: hypothetical protein M1308_05720 [Actinobacteria bacterium]|nr:hypothetical protein [Actinomycetota bacterium]